jgi:hypothetical protein
MRDGRDGPVVDYREGHNVWVDGGREYLAELLAFTSFGPDTRERDDRPKFIGFGIGSVDEDASATSPPFSTSYSAGNDPNATSGNEYNHAFPVSPLISTLERPVRFTGGTTDYPGVGGDEWLRVVDTVTHFGLYQTNYRIIVDSGAGDLEYGTFTPMPLTEVGLFLSSKTPTGTAFNTLVAYYNFSVIQFADPYVLEVLWQVGF